MSERKLATIQKIVKLEPISGADAIEKATVLGWELVVKKREFQEGDLCVYIEIDSQLPDKPEFEFLRSRKFRIKTIKLKGQVSQGIAFPINIFSPALNTGILNEGDDVTELLGITKYDPQLQEENIQKQYIPKNTFEKFLMKFSFYRKLIKPKKGWPSFVKKTDEDRIQLFPHICETEKDTTFQVSEKLDGQSASYFLIKNDWWNIFNKFTFGVCSRNIWKKTEDDSSYWQIAKKYNIKNILLKDNKDRGTLLTIQGEICGPGIQKNKYKLKEIDFFVYKIVDNNDYFIYPNNFIEVFCKKYNLKHVPFPDFEFKLKPTIKEMVEYSKGNSLINTEVLREGIVVRNYEKNISFKVINPNFLLKHEE